MKDTETDTRDGDRTADRLVWIVSSVATALLAGVIYGLYALGGYMTAMAFVAGLVVVYVVTIVTRMRRKRAEEEQERWRRWRKYG